MSVLVEAVACTVDDAIAAEEAGARRIELVSAISEGGLTPSVGTLRGAVCRVKCPVVAMLRPRGGSFVYSPAEIDTMAEDARVLIDAGAAGLVTGALTPHGGIAVTMLRRIMRACDSATWIFHRAFDHASEPFRALEELIDLGFLRVLTSGQAATALGGVDRLRELAGRAAGRIEIMPGGGVRADNVHQIALESGASSVHMGPFRASREARTGAEHLSIDADAVRDAVKALEE